MIGNKITIESPIEEKISWAKTCHRDVREFLLEDERVAGLLSHLTTAGRASHEAMSETGIVDDCKTCEQDGGSCCGRGIENRYSGVLLLINLLLGRDLPEGRKDDGSCFFLGKDGCFLKARHVICINYLCKRITDRVPPEKMTVLREKEGIELECLFLLNERLKAILKTI